MHTALMPAPSRFHRKALLVLGLGIVLSSCGGGGGGGSPSVTTLPDPVPVPTPLPDDTPFVDTSVHSAFALAADDGIQPTSDIFINLLEGDYVELEFHKIDGTTFRVNNTGEKRIPGIGFENHGYSTFTTVASDIRNVANGAASLTATITNVHSDTDDDFMCLGITKKYIIHKMVNQLMPLTALLLTVFIWMSLQLYHQVEKQFTLECFMVQLLIPLTVIYVKAIMWGMLF